MKEILPVVIICIVGMALCLAYLVFVAVTSARKRFFKNRRNSFEIEDDVLTVKLGRAKKK